MTWDGLDGSVSVSNSSGLTTTGGFDLTTSNGNKDQIVTKVSVEVIIKQIQWFLPGNKAYSMKVISKITVVRDDNLSDSVISGDGIRLLVENMLESNSLI